jgi:serine/threonine-protein kinase
VSLKSGDRIERYVIDALLGSGGMGEVYRAHDARLQRAVALKILRADKRDGTGSGSSGSGADRMLREARAAAALDHPNVVSVYDVGQIETPEELRGTTYIAMELLKGAPLRSFVGDPSVPIERRVSWLADVARALGAAHAQGLVHRDVKPENVMILGDGRVKVLDFGIAKRTTTVAADAFGPTEASPGMLTAEGVVVGTPLYMAPEQMRGETLDGRADQFSWGVVAYELLTGKVPWVAQEGGALAVVAQILSSDPAPLSVRPEVPAHVARAVTRALAKDRGARFASMEALVGELAGSGGWSPLAMSAEAPVSSLMAGAASAPSGGSGATGATGSVEARPQPAPARPRLVVPAITAVGFAALIGGGLLVARRPPKEEPKVAPAVNPGCTSARACTERHGGEPSVCRASDHACVPIASEDCKPLFEPGDLTAEDTVWFGAMFPTKDGDPGTMWLDGVEFARKEVAQATMSLEGTHASQRVRHLALVACDDSVDPMRAAKHLVDDVGVPAIIGFHSGQETTDVAGGLLVGRQVLTIAPLTTHPLVTRLPQPPGLPRMVWRTTFSSAQAAEATAVMLEKVLEPKRGAKPTKVTVLRPNNHPGHLAFAESFYRKLVFNGRPAKDNGADYQEAVYGDDAKSEPGLTQFAERVAAASPTFVVVVGDPAVTAPLVTAIDARAPRPKPIYLAEMTTTGSFPELLRKTEDARKRLFSVNSVSNSMANARFVIRYNESHSQKVTRTLNAGNCYDAFYLLAYATFAVGQEPVTGISLAKAFARLLPPGHPVEVGPTNIFEAVATLSSGGSIDLEGTQSRLDYDLGTGEAPSDFTLVCPGVDTSGRPSGEDVESGLIARGDGRIEGTLKCP